MRNAYGVLVEDRLQERGGGGGLRLLRVARGRLDGGLVRRALARRLQRHLRAATEQLECDRTQERIENRKYRVMQSSTASLPSSLMVCTQSGNKEEEREGKHLPLVAD